MKPAWLLLSLGLFAQCSRTPPVTPSPQQTFAERELALVQGVAPFVPGQWKLTEARYRRVTYFESPANWPADTLVAQLATLTLRPAQLSRPPQLEHPEFEGELTYAGKTYPVAFKLWANPDQVVNKQGPPAYFRLDYNFPVGSHQTEVVEQFLQDVGLVGSQFTLEVAAGRNTIQWLGLDRHLRAITLRKQ